MAEQLRELRNFTEPEMRVLMNDIAHAVVAASERHGLGGAQFALVLFNDPKVAQYVSSCERATMITAMRETAKRLERRQDVTR